MATDLQNRPDQDSDPIQRSYDDEFNHLTSPEHFNRDGETSTNSTGAADSSSLRQAEEQDGLFNSRGDGAAATAVGTGTAALGAAEALGNGFNPVNQLRSAGKLGNMLFGSRRRKQATIGGSVVGIVVGGGLFAVSILSGPLEFVHFAQLLTKYHFASQSDAQDGRLTKELRFYKYTSVGEVEKTRLGFMGNKYANVYEAKLNSQGLQSAYSDKFGLFDGYVIDRNAPQFKGKSDKQISELVKEKYGVDVKLGSEIKGSGSFIDKKLVIDGTKLSARQTRQLTRTLLAESGDEKLSASIGARLMGKRFGVPWHPIKKIDAKILRSLEARAKEWRKNQAKTIAEGETPPLLTEDKTNKDPKATQAEKDAAARAASAQAEATDVQSSGSEAGSKVSSGEPGALDGFKSNIKGKLLGGAAITGILCLLRGIAENADSIKQAQVVAPLVRMGVEFVSLGNQIMSGQGVDQEQLAQFSKLMHGTDQNGNVTSWNQAESLQAEAGATGGVKPDNTLMTIGAGTPFDFLVSGAPGAILAPVCSTAIQTGIAIISFFGGPISALVGLAASMAVLPPVVSAAAHWLAGKAVDPFPHGADTGNYANFGTFLAAGDQSNAASGVIMTPGQTAAVKAATYENDTKEFQTHTIAYRIFSPTDSRSLFASLIDKQNPSIGPNFASIAASLTGIGRSILSSFGSLFTARASAATGAGYTYGDLPTIGIDEQLLNDPRFENPYENANKAAAILDGTDGPSYIDQVFHCFGDTIAKDGSGRWNVTSERNASPTYAQLKKLNCQKRDEDWLRIRMLILDTESMAPMACLAGDGQSCSDVGFGDTSNSASGTAPAPADTTALYQDSTNIPCAAGTNNVGIFTGYHDENPVNIRLCAVTDLPNSNQESATIPGANGDALVNSRVSAAYYAMAQASLNDGVKLQGLSSFRTMEHQQSLCAQNAACSAGDYTKVAKPGTSNHQMGLAIDFATSDGVTSISAGDKWFTWLTNNAAKFGIKNYPAENWHWSPTGN